MPNCRFLPSAGPVRWLLLLIAGGLAPLGFAPIDLWPLTLVSMALFLALCHDAARPLRDGWLYGLGFYGVGTSWVFVSIHQFGPAPVWLAALLTLLFVTGVALFFALPAWLLRRLPATALSWALGFPAIWVLAEWFRSWFLTGFPWLLSGYAAIDTWLAGWAPLVGVYGLSYLIALGTVGLWLLLTRTTKPRLAALALLLGIALSSWWLNDTRWTRPSGESLTIAIVQGNIDQNLKWQPQERERIFSQYLQPTLAQLDRDLILWPETAIPLLLDQAAPWLSPLEQRLEQSQTTLISGVPSREPAADSRWRYHNSIIARGTGSGIYHKQRLVPFGEYVPLEHWLRGLIRFFDLPMSNFSLGPVHQPPLRSGNLALAPFICYEIVYPELVRSAALQSDFLLTISNDAWFGDSLAPHQHLQMARMRALENGRQLIRGTNNGISALIDERGTVLSQSPQFEQAVLTGRVEQLSGTTPFTRLGSWPVLGWCLLSVLGVLVSVKVRGKAAQPRSVPRSR